MKRRPKRRPKRVIITMQWRWSGKIQHRHDMPYDCIDMVNGRYRKIIQKLKALFLNDEIYREERAANGNKIQTSIQFIY